MPWATALPNASAPNTFNESQSLSARNSRVCWMP